MTTFRVAGALAVALTAPWLWVATAHAEGFAQLGQVPVVASPTCAGNVSAEAQVTPVQIDDRVEDGVRVAIHYNHHVDNDPYDNDNNAADDVY